MGWAYAPSLVLMALTVGLAALHTVVFYRVAFGGAAPVATPVCAVLVALFAVVVFPLAFFSIGAFAASATSEALEAYQASGHPLSRQLEGIAVLTADGALAGAFTYFVTFGTAAAVMGATVCASRHLLRARSS